MKRISGIMRNLRISRIFAVFCILFILFFPKAGFKIEEIPITFGYILIGVIIILLFIRRVVTLDFSINLAAFLILLLSLPFHVYFIYQILDNGHESNAKLLASLISLVAFPWVFLIFLPRYFNYVDQAFLEKWLARGVLFTAAYGILLFFYVELTGEFIEIPFLTMNYGDLGELQNKFNNRGGVFKLISTYNNGNIYGLCMLMLFPLYHYIEKSVYKRLIVNAALILTLSRTVWVGLAIFHVFRLLFGKLNFMKVVKFIMLAIVILIVLSVVLQHLNRSIFWIFDPSLGGRIGGVTRLHWQLFSDYKFFVIGEMTYVSIFYNFGFMGLILFMLMLFSPIIFGLNGNVSYARHPFKLNIMGGLSIYLIMAFVDGAMMFIPVMSFFWILVAWLCSSNEHFEIKEDA